MTAADAESLTLDLSHGARVSALWQSPKDPVAAFVFAHGAGAGMSHPFMAAAASGLETLGVATLRYQFPYMERGGKRPDPPALCHATVRSAVAAARKRAPQLAAFAGGKSFGARMTSQAQALSPLPGVLGLAFFGFPLHPPKQPSDSRAVHLSRVTVPMLFLQGSRDEFADRSLLLPLMERLGKRTKLRLLEHADHSFHVPVRSGRKDGEVLSEALQILVDWMTGITRGCVTA